MTTKFWEYFKFSLIASSILLIVGCNGSDKPVANDTCDTCRGGILKSFVKEVSTTPQKPTSATLIFDISGSMKGYLSGDNDGKFRGTLAAFTNLTSDVECYFYGTSMSSKMSKDVFRDKRDNNGIPWVGESNIREMIKTMTSDVANVSILVSDGIMSGSEKQVTGTDWNKKHGPEMSSDLYGMLSPYAGKRSLLMIRYESIFSGKYSFYDNSGKTINQSRPYFVIIMGEWEYVKWVEEYLKEGKDSQRGGSEFSYTDVLVIGDSLSYTKHRISPRKNVEYKNGKYIAKKGKERDTLVFSLDLSSMPSYMQDSVWLSSHIEMTSRTNAKVTPVPYNKYSIDVESSTKGNILLLKFSPIHPKQQQLDFRIKYELPAIWTTGMYSCLDDKKSGMMDRTFNLKYLVEGFSALTTLKDDKYIYEQLLQF